MSEDDRERRIRLATQAITVAAALAVGMLLGGQFCAPDSPPPAEPDCPPAPTEIVEYCPPEEPEPPENDAPPADPVVDPPPEDSPSQALPDSPPTVAPAQRQRLLGWARDRSTTLQSCPRDRGKTYRFAVTLTLDEQRQIEAVDLSSDERLRADLRDCLSSRIAQWPLPDDIEITHDEVVFRLSL